MTSLTAPPRPPPEKQSLEKFQVKNQSLNSTLGYSKEKKRIKINADPVSGSEEQSHLVCNLKGSIRDASSGPFFKLNTVDAIWSTIMNSQLSRTASLPPSAALSGNHELLPGGWCWPGAGSCDTLANDRSEENGICRSLESLGWRSYECSDAEAWLIEFSDPLARA